MSMEKLDIKRLSPKELLSEYNAAARYLGEAEVNRFADRTAAERRTSAILERAAQKSALADGTPPTLASGPVALGTTSPGAIQVNDSGSALVNIGPDSFKLELSAEDKAQVTSEAKGPRQAREKDEAKKAPAPAPNPAPPAPRAPSERWRAPKHEDASKVAYRPKPGTFQGEMYDALTRAEGIDIEEFSAIVRATGTKSTSCSPPGVWSSLRYLFVANRGYGLDFDGKMLRLLIPADERLNRAKD